MQSRLSTEEIQKLIGTELGTSEWFLVDQERVNQFADVTLDRAYYHVDPVRAKTESIYGGTIAHGFLTLSLMAHLTEDLIEKVLPPGNFQTINTGLDKVVFSAPVPVGSKIRARMKLLEFEMMEPGKYVYKFRVEAEVEGNAKKAVTSEWQVFAIQIQQ